MTTSTRLFLPVPDMDGHRRIFGVGILIAASVAGAACGGGYRVDVPVVQGHVRRADGTPIAGVRIRCTWPDEPGYGTEDRTTAGDGAYQAPLWDAHMVLTPSMDGYQFTPPSVDLVATEDPTVIDFVGEPVAEPSTLYVLLVFTWVEGAVAEGVGGPPAK